MHVCFLGTASGRPLPDRFGQTVVVTVENEECGPGHYLLDVGDGASSLLLQHGYDHTAIRAIVISHMHADHHGGFAQVIKTCMHLKRSQELVVLAPEEGIPALQSYLQASYLIEPMLGYSIRWVSLADAMESVVALPENVVLRAYANTHLDSARHRFAMLGLDGHGHSFESYSMALEHENVRIVYSGNLNGVQGADELTSFLEPCTLLICELAHVDPTELGRVLAGRKVDTIVLSHFHPKWHDTTDEELLAQIVAGADGGGDLGMIVFTHDGDRVACIPADPVRLAHDDE